MRRRVFLILALLAATLPASAQTTATVDSLSLRLRAVRAYEAGRFDECADFYLAAIRNGDSTAGIYYDAACCMALAAREAEALAHLEGAIVRGYSNVQHMQRDPDLVPLHDAAQWPGLVQRMSEAQEAYLARSGIHRELFFMMKEDQAARVGEVEQANWDSIAAKDRERNARVVELIARGELAHAADFYNAALISQHGSDSASYRRAHELALRAVELDSTFRSARWLAAAAWDRYQQSLNRPQVYGTQYRKSNDGDWTMEPYDTTAVTDEERARWGVPPLAEQRRRLAEMNGDPEP